MLCNFSIRSLKSSFFEVLCDSGASVCFDDSGVRSVGLCLSPASDLAGDSLFVAELSGLLWSPADFERSFLEYFSPNSLAWRISSGSDKALEIRSRGMASRLSAVSPSGRLSLNCLMASISDFTWESESRGASTFLVWLLFNRRSRSCDKNFTWPSGCVIAGFGGGNHRCDGVSTGVLLSDCARP